MTHDNKTRAALDALDVIGARILRLDGIYAWNEEFDTIRTALTEAAELKAQNAELLEALGFYAGHDMYVVLGQIDDSLLEASHHECDTGVPFGTRARKAIAREEKGTSHD